tara:strand:- start:129 stop:494 length:366 start_codon:yes stop_codon:yes gene_type:complete
MSEAMDHEGDVVKSRYRKFIIFLMNGIMSLLLIILMLFLVHTGYWEGVVECPEGHAQGDGLWWSAIYGIPVLLLINIQSYLATRGSHSSGIRGMVFGLTVGILVAFVFMYAGGYAMDTNLC